MIDDIRKKHEAQVAYTKEKQGNFPYLFQSIQSNLRISEVDALFAALGEASGIVDRFKAFVDERDRIYGGMMARDQLQVVFKQILKGGGEDE